MGGGLATFVIALLIFHAGFVAGSRRFEPAGRGPHEFGLQFPHGFVAGGHGAVGTIDNWVPPTLTLTTRGGDKETVLVGTTTRIEPPGATSTLLVPGARVIIIGTPDTDGLQANVIRMLP